MRITDESLLTLEEVAKQLRCSKITIRRAYESGKLTCIKPSGKYGRSLFKVKDVKAFLERGKSGKTEDPTQTEYRLAVCENAGSNQSMLSFSRQVNNWIKEGFRPIGSIAVVPETPESYPSLVQPMLRE